MKPPMNRHERGLLRSGTVLLVAMLVLRLDHFIGAGTATTLMLFGGLFVVSALARYNRRLRAENHALSARINDPAARR